ncbi:MAG TPA: ABC transporter permease [Myxococcaceae bacterium]|nr:ABC transporter permease [Myxococcaceae bacterium]
MNAAEASLEAAREKPAAAPVRARHWLQVASERLNPIVIKEVRQGLRTKAFWVFFGLMLAACLVIAMVAFGTTQNGTLDASGQLFFFAFFVPLAVVSFLLVPYSAYRSLAREREDDTWVLLTLTGLGARKILRGKLVSALLQALLYASAAAPFVLFSYFLNGIDLPTILITLGLGLAYTIFLVCLSVSAATLGDTRVTRAMAHLGLLGLLLFLTFSGLGLAANLAEGPHGITADSDLFKVLAVGLWVMTSYAVLVFEGAAARLSLLTEDYARGPRIAAVVQWLVSVVIIGAIWLAGDRPHQGAAVMSIILCVHLGLIGMFLASDVDGQAQRHRPRTRWFSLLRPGALRGYRLVVALMAGTMLAALGVVAASNTSFVGHATDATLAAVMAAPAYALLYLSVPIVLTRMGKWGVGRSPRVTQGVTLALTVVGCGLPPLISILIGEDSDEPIINLFNPIITLVRLLRERSTPVRDGGGLLAIWACAVVAVLIADRLLAARDGERVA